MTTTTYAGRFDFEDGGTYCGGWEDGKAHGHGVCTGPKSMGEFSGLWQFGYEVSGVYIWPSGNCFLGQWMSGKRHGLGVEKKQRWIYKGEWSQGFKGRYGCRVSESSGAKYEGTWANGLQDGYGSETYADGGTYFGQMMQGMRNGYGIRKSVAYGVASRYRSKDVKDSMTSLRSEDGDEKVQRERDRRFDENRGGFVLRAKSDLTEEVAVGGGVTSLIISTNQAVGGGNIMSNAINSLMRRRRNSLTQQQQQQHSHMGGSSAERKPSLRKTIMSKLKKQKSVGDIDEQNAVGGGSAGSSSHLNKLGLGGGSSSRGGHSHHHHGNNKKSSFRSTSSNNSVDSRVSNRTAPAGLSAVNTLLLNGGHVSGGLHHNNQNNNQAMMDDGEHSFISQDEITDINCIEVYMGEWKQDKRTGYGIAERSDGLKYEGEWFNNKKNGYGVTTFKDGTKEEGKYKNNVLTTDKKKSSGKMMLLRPNKLRQKIDAAVNAALKAGQIAQQRADIALARAVNARTKAHAAELSGKQSQADSDYARIKAREVAPDFVQPGETKKQAEIAFDIDRMHMNHPYSFQPQIMPHLHQGGALNISDHSPAGAAAAAMSQMSPPNQFRKLPLNMQTNRPPDHLMMNDPHAAAAYMNWQHQQSQQHSSYTPHSSTPPPNTSSPRQMTPGGGGGGMQYHQYDSGGLIIPASQLQQQQSQQMLDNTSQKLSNEMIGGGMMDPQTLAHLQQQLHHNQASSSSLHPKQHHMFQHNYSFDEQQLLHSPSSLLQTPGGGGGGQSLLQQAQSHSFNMDHMTMLNTATPGGGVSTSSMGGGGNNNNQMMMDSYLQHQMFQHSLPKRSTLKRSQRLTDTSLEEEAAAAAAANYMMMGMPQLSPEQIMSLTPPQQQQYLLMRAQQQHYSQNSNTTTGGGPHGPESGIGSSVYTNSNNNSSSNNNNDLLQNNNLPAHLQQHLNRQQQQQSSYINNISPHSIISSQGSTPGGGDQLHLDPSRMTGAGGGGSSQQSPHHHHQDIPVVVQLPRRKSLPSMVKSKSFKEDETAHSSSDLNKRNAELYIIENGIRKRVTERTNSALNANRDNDTTGGGHTTTVDADGNERVLPRIYHYENDDESAAMELPRKIVLESITSLNNNHYGAHYTTVSKRVSMPSIPAYLNPKFANKVMSREEANRLSSLRRDELRKNEELERNKLLKIRNMLRNDSISMFLKQTVDCSIQTDDEDYLNWIKDGILRNRIFLLIILFNISLAIWFLQMLK